MFQKLVLLRKIPHFLTNTLCTVLLFLLSRGFSPPNSENKVVSQGEIKRNQNTNGDEDSDVTNQLE